MQGSLQERQLAAIEDFLLGSGTAASGSGAQLSEYEQQRLQNIAENQQMLERLGLGDGP